MLSAVALLALIAQQSPPGAPAATGAKHARRLLVMDFRNDGVDPRTVLIIRDALTANLSRAKTIEVLSTEDVRRTLDVEAQKAASGCTADHCMTELANALGADYIVFGNIGTLGGLLVGNMSMLDAAKGASLGRESIEVRSLEELPAAVRAAGDRLIAPVAGPVEKPAPWMLYAGGAGAVVGAGAAVLGGVVSAGAYGVITDQVSLAKTKDRAVDDFNIYSAVAVAGGALAIAGAGAAVYALVAE